MQQLTYKQAYNKIIEAYFKDEIQSYNAEFCFCGTLSPVNRYAEWYTSLYSSAEYRLMEKALLTIIRDQTVGECACDIYGGTGHTYDNRYKIICHENYETALFNGMCAALEVLKEIHRSRGENVDEDI